MGRIDSKRPYRCPANSATSTACGLEVIFHNGDYANRKLLDIIVLNQYVSAKFAGLYRIRAFSDLIRSKKCSNSLILMLYYSLIWISRLAGHFNV